MECCKLFNIQLVAAHQYEQGITKSFDFLVVVSDVVDKPMLTKLISLLYRKVHKQFNDIYKYKTIFSLSLVVLHVFT